MSSQPRSAVIFLQNPWFPPDTDPEIVESYMRDIHFRRKTLAETMTGRRLSGLFGPTYHDIWWDNAHPRPVLGDHRGSREPDPEHMLRVILERRPTAIGLMGQNAAIGLEKLADSVPLFFQHNRVFGARIYKARHPNAMGCTTEELENFSEAIINHIIGVFEI